MARAATVTKLPAVDVINPVTQQAFAQIKVEVQHQFLERDDEVTAVLCALLARLNVLAYGDPGTGKSDLLETVATRLRGTFRRWLMDRQQDKSELLGLMNLKHYEDTGEQKRNRRNTIFEADIAHFDEVDKCGPGVTTPLLTAINEHKADDGTEWVELDILTAMGAANQELEAGQEAFADRFVVKLVFERLQQDENVMALLESALVPRVAGAPTVIPIEDARHAVFVEVPAVEVPRAVLQELLAIRKELAKVSIFPSDRKLKLCVRLVQAHAYLNGRTVATLDDLAILRHALWDMQEERAKVAEIVLEHTGLVTRTALKLMRAVMEANAELDKAKIEDGKPGAGVAKTDLSSVGGRLLHQIGQLNDQVKKARAQAVDDDSPVNLLDEVTEQINELHVRCFVECMGTPEKAARAMVLSGV